MSAKAPRPTVPPPAIQGEGRGTYSPSPALRLPPLEALNRARQAFAPRPTKPFQELDVRIEAALKTMWCFMRPKGPPSYTRGMLRELADMQRSIPAMFAEAPEHDPPLHYFVLASHLEGIFNLGGELSYFAECIRAQNREALTAYAHACIEVLYNNATAFRLPMVTIALVQGDALGGGFESALACDVLIAEKRARFGLPEILFNLFPGMGAYSLLARKLDAARAERMILSGHIYTAEQLHEMGLVTVLAEDGEGEAAARDYIARNARRHAVHHSIYSVGRRINPLTFEELQDVIALWVDAALRLQDADLRRMERLSSAQAKRLASVQGDKV